LSQKMAHLENSVFVVEFLETGVHNESTRRIYTNGIQAFNNFYQPQGTIGDFFTRLDADLMLPKPKQVRVATTNLRAFIKYMKERGYSDKTINTYTNAFRALVSYRYDYDYSIPIKNSGLPSSEAESDKKDWSLELISEFFQSFDNPLYQTILAVIVQSGLGIEDVLALKFSDIQAEFEAGTTPLLLTLKRHKTGVKFETFLGTIAVQQIKVYFKIVGTPKPDSRIFPVTKGSVDRFFARRARKLLLKEMEKAARAEGKELAKDAKPWEHFNPMRPHSLRSAFQKLLVLAGCPEILSEYWMGHETDRQKGCYILKGLSQKELREQYIKFSHALSFEINKGDKID
jgi:integrase